MHKQGRKLIIIGVILTLIALFVAYQPAQAGYLTAMSDTMSRMKESIAADHTIKFTTVSAVDPGDTMTVIFPTGFTIGSVDHTDIDLEDDGTDLPLAATPGTGAGSDLGAAFSGQTLTITENDTDSIAAGSVITIEIGLNATYGVAGDQQITNQTVAQNNTDPVIVLGGTFGDDGKLAVEILSDDQVAVTGDIDPTLTFTISDTTIGFGTLTTADIYYATGDENGATVEPGANLPVNLVVSTNAASGAAITVQDEGDGSAAGLYKATTPTHRIDAVASNTVAAGTEGYGVYGKGASGLTIDEKFNDDGAADGPITRAAQTFASSTGPVSSADVDLTLKAGISGITPPGNYADTITVICTGIF